MYPSIFNKFVKNPRIEPQQNSEVAPSDRVITPANVMTLSRVPLAVECARRLRKGQKGALKFAIASAASDMEGIAARTIDRLFPESGYGTSVAGAEWDPRVDTAAALVIATGVLLAPRVSLLGKTSVSIVLGQEGLKTAWALKADMNYRSLTHAVDHLSMQPTKGGKEAMAEKLTSLCGAVAINETDSPMLRTSLGVGATSLAISGALRGEEARHEYVQELSGMFYDFESVEQSNWDMARLNEL